MNSLLGNPANLNSNRGFRDLTDRPFPIRILRLFVLTRFLHANCSPRCLRTPYSAADALDAINIGFLLAADSMKSLMRGTISERKREPLNTP